MTYSAKIVADSIAFGVRLTTLEVVMPRFILAEFNTHRVFSRNSASSRAIPVEKRIAAIRADPFVPEAFGANKRGMQAGEALGDDEQAAARLAWVAAMETATRHAAILAQLGVHKQWANRLLEPFAWHTVVVTATEWDNFFALRISSEAQPEIRRVAEAMKAAMDASTPVGRLPGEWHLPYTDERDQMDVLVRHSDPTALSTALAVRREDELAKLSSARCARVSYLTHDGLRDVNADLALHDKLLASGHMSPFEHAAKVAIGGDYLMRTSNGPEFVSNFRFPWIQYRKTIPGEDVFRART